ncbi:MAG: FGGY-family carbohydrate kinase [Mogibacterium sp.]|nr:FGGY-family carbohydrate kinase [Mogibacterium sp.]
MEPVVLTFDIGTQSTRAILARKDGSFVDTYQYKYDEPYFADHPLWAEQKPNFYYDAICKTSKEILARNKDVVKDIICVTVTTIRDTVLCLDKNNKPLGNIIMWLDAREAKYEPEKVPALHRKLFRAVGMLETIEYQYRSSTCNWLMQNDPKRWENTGKYVFLSAYLNLLMTGNLVDSTGSLIGHMPFDAKKRAWMDKKGLTYAVYAIPEEKLVDFVEPGEIVGNITEECSAETGIPAGLPLIATGSDKGCETVGLSVHKLGTAAVSFGTSATIQIADKKYIEPQPFMPAYCAAIPGMYNPEIQIYRGYWMLTWFIREFCQEESRIATEKGIITEELLNEYLKDIPAGCDGLMIQPYWSPGVNTPNARGSMVGFNDRQTKYHIYRAIIEGINFELMCAKKTLEKQSKVPITEIYVGGGGANSKEILQITADMFGIPVKRIQTNEASGLGSSLVGFVSMGEFDSYEEASAAMIHTGDIYYPDPEQHKLYSELFAIYEKLYGSLKKTYNKEKLIYRRKYNG